LKVVLAMHRHGETKEEFPRGYDREYLDKWPSEKSAIGISSSLFS
jgi:hypothetical protein